MVRPTTVARTVKSPVFSPALSAGATATPVLLVTTVATLSPPVKVVSVSPTTVKRTRTLATATPSLVSARVLIFWVNASPAVAVSVAVPASSRWSTVSVGGWGGEGGVGGGVLGGGVDGGGVDGGVVAGEVGLWVPPPGLLPGLVGPPE